MVQAKRRRLRFQNAILSGFSAQLKDRAGLFPELRLLDHGYDPALIERPGSS
jgi:hypothetical protein